MDDKLILGRGRLYFASGLAEPIIDQGRRWTWEGRVEMSPNVAAHLAMALGRDPTSAIVGYDPQMLLPSPERSEQQRLDALEREAAEWWGRLAAEIFPDAMAWGEAYIEFSPTGRPRGIPLPMISPGDEIKLGRTRERTFEHRAAVVPADKMTPELMSRLAADPSIRVIHIDTDRPSGMLETHWPKIDYQMAEMRAFGHMLKDRKEPAPHPRSKPQPSYLKHDPSKRYKPCRKR